MERVTYTGNREVGSLAATGTGLPAENDSVSCEFSQARNTRKEAKKYKETR